MQAIEHGLAEEAFEIYKKFDKKVEAICVLLEHVPEDGLKRAFDYATKVRCVCFCACPCVRVHVCVNVSACVHMCLCV